MYKNATISVSIKGTIEMLVVSIKSLFTSITICFTILYFRKTILEFCFVIITYLYNYLVKHVILYQIDNSFKELTFYIVIFYFLTL